MTSPKIVTTEAPVFWLGISRTAHSAGDLPIQIEANEQSLVYDEFNSENDVIVEGSIVVLNDFGV